MRAAEADEDHVIQIYLPPELSEEVGHAVFSQEENEEAAEPKLVLNSSTITPIIRRFFESLTQE